MTQNSNPYFPFLKKCQKILNSEYNIIFLPKINYEKCYSTHSE